MKRVLLVLGLMLSSASAWAVPLTFTNQGVVGQTTVFRAALGGLGLVDLGSLTVTDSNSGTGGSPGVFSGFDLDFLFVDLDGDFATAADRVFASSFLFTTGTIRPTANPSFQPTALRPGPTFGSAAANVIDPALSTLNVLDGDFSSGLSTDLVSGWLTLGDGGVLRAGFAPPIALTGSEALFLGEVGTGVGELVSASVEISSQPLPLPSTPLLLGLGLAALGLRRRSARTA